MKKETRIQLNYDTTLIRAEEGVYFGQRSATSSNRTMRGC